MRVFLALSMVSCAAETQAPSPEQVEVSASPSSAQKLTQTSEGPSTLGMVAIPAGTVVMGPRHLPPVSSAYAPTVPKGAKGGKIPPPPPLKPGTDAPWVSMGGQGLSHRSVEVQPFLIDRTEVTRLAYGKFLQATGYRLPNVSEPWADDGWNWTLADGSGAKEQHPVVLTSFYDARSFCRWKKKRLPTESEWQMAALGPSHEQRVYPWGGRYIDSALNHGRMEEPNFDGSDGYERTAPVGSFSTGNSPYGPADMFGNAWEFTSDFRVDDWRWFKHDGYGENSALINARMPLPGLQVAVRGGSYYFDFRPNPGGERNSFSPEIRRKSTGFRCAMSQPK
jgi:formylglycine-generating enzyme required for sulfatase activity